MRVWNYRDTIDAIRDIAMSNPDHVDPNAANRACRYIGNDGEAECIVGVFLVDKVGLSVSEVSPMDTESPLGEAISIECTTNYDVCSRLSADAIHFLSIVQRGQDEGRTWMEAFENALPLD